MQWVSIDDVKELQTRLKGLSVTRTETEGSSIREVIFGAGKRSVRFRAGDYGSTISAFKPKMDEKWLLTRKLHGEQLKPQFFDEEHLAEDAEVLFRSQNNANGIDDAEHCLTNIKMVEVMAG